MNDTIKILYLFLLTFVLILVSAISLSVFYNTDYGNVVVIKVDGEIGYSSSVLSGSVDSSDIVDYLISADNNPNIEAIVLEINSPGGTVVASKEIAEQILLTNKTVVALIKDMGTSGAYLIASASDYIISDELSIIGNIGSKMSYLGFSGTLEKYNATYYNISSGTMKEIGNPYTELSDAELIILQSLVDESFEYFLEFVTVNRNLTDSSINIIKDGRILSGNSAYELGLVDELGSRVELINYLESINVSDISMYYLQSNEIDLTSLINFNSNLVFPTYD